MLYIGRRLGDNGDVLQCFLHNKKKYFWKGISYAVIGGRFEANKNETGEIYMSRKARVISNIEQDRIKQEWIDSDLAAEAFLKEKREKNKAKENISKKDWELLKPFHLRAKNLSVFERDAFANYVRRLIILGHK